MLRHYGRCWVPTLVFSARIVTMGGYVKGSDLLRTHADLDVTMTLTRPGIGEVDARHAPKNVAAVIPLLRAAVLAKKP